nr:MAG TPA: hypothetical protein [Caudoviricetes sp.]
MHNQQSLKHRNTDENRMIFPHHRKTAVLWPLYQNGI